MTAGPHLPRGVHALGDVRRLLVQRDEDADRVGVEPELAAHVADVAHAFAGQARVVEDGLGGQLARDHDQAGRQQRLDRHPRSRILREGGVEDRVGDLIGHLVRMPAGHRLRGEDEAVRVPGAHRLVLVLFLIGALFLVVREPAGPGGCFAAGGSTAGGRCSLRTCAAPATMARSLARATSAGRWRSPQSGLITSLSAGTNSSARRMREATRSGGSTSAVFTSITPSPTPRSHRYCWNNCRSPRPLRANSSTSWSIRAARTAGNRKS